MQNKLDLARVASICAIAATAGQPQLAHPALQDAFDQQFAQESAAVTLHGQSEQEIICRCCHIFSPEIIRSRVCPQCGFDIPEATL